MEFTRRDFLKTTGATTAVLAAGLGFDLKPVQA
ncbi:MAG: twin-arginine translocation signal domain-containing protein, partial [Candidatus Methylomirabilales bacterium]